jgi:hypothetical protein
MASKRKPYPDREFSKQLVDDLAVLDGVAKLEASLSRAWDQAALLQGHCSLVHFYELCSLGDDLSEITKSVAQRREQLEMDIRERAVQYAKKSAA